ncbi:MAG TPA: hypothetical protein VII01_01940 [Solirubrobacteraceae bacterium]|jgi:hypothetical protein
MPRLPAARPTLALLSVPLCGLVLAACGTTVSTGSFKGEQHEVAQVISNLQADTTAGEQKKVCANDVSAAVVAKLGGTKGCEKAIKSQLAEVDNLNVTIQSIAIAPGGSTATAHVTSTYEGKAKAGTVGFVKEGKVWKISTAS